MNKETKQKEENKFHVLWLNVLLSTRESIKRVGRLDTQTKLCRSASRVPGFSF